MEFKAKQAPLQIGETAKFSIMIAGKEYVAEVLRREKRKAFIHVYDFKSITRETKVMESIRKKLSLDAQVDFMEVSRYTIFCFQKIFASRAGEAQVNFDDVLPKLNAEVKDDEAASSIVGLCGVDGVGGDYDKLLPMLKERLIDLIHRDKTLSIAEQSTLLLMSINLLKERKE